jgi:septal ring factor EnvC (AmiA/AmiB activator)
MKHVTALVALALWLLPPPASALAQTNDEIQTLKQAIDELRGNQQRIERELTEIKNFLRARMAAPPSAAEEPKNLVLSLDGEHVKGDKAARLALVDFTDYQ